METTATNRHKCKLCSWQGTWEALKNTHWPIQHPEQWEAVQKWLKPVDHKILEAVRRVKEQEEGEEQ